MNYILMNTEIKRELMVKYNEYNNTLYNKLTFKKFLQNKFNNNNRGILYNKICNNPLKIKIWSIDTYMILEELNDRKGFRILRLKDITNKEYNLRLQYYKVLKGEWDFDLISSYVISDGDYDYLKEEESYNEKRDEFEEFHKYWLSYDLITQKKEEKSRENEKLSLTKYKSISVNFDKNNSILIITPTEYNYKKGDRIIISNTGAIGEYRGNSISGIVEEYRKDLNKIVITFKNAAILNDLYKDEKYKKGFIYLDDIGSKTMIKRQKEALKKLLNRETTNKRMRDFMPDIENVNISKNNLYGEVYIDNYKNKMNTFQINAIKGALECSDIYLIQGPPGTGKTSVIYEIIKEVTKASYDVLVASQSHIAVDNVLQMISENDYIKAIRIGDEEKIELGCEKYLLENRVKKIRTDIENKLITFNEDNKYLFNELEINKELVIAYQNSKEKIKAVNVLLLNFRERNKVRDTIIKEIEKKEIEKKILEKKFNRLNDIFKGYDLNDVDSIFMQFIDALSAYGLVINNLELIGEQLSRVLVYDDEFMIMNLYNDSVEALESSVLEYKNIKNQKLKIMNELGVIRENYENLRNMIISLGDKYKYIYNQNSNISTNTKVNKLINDLKELKNEYEDKEVCAKTIEFNLKKKLEIVYKLSDKADKYKDLFDEIMIKNIDICRSKEELINIIKLKKYLLNKFPGKEEYFKYIRYLEKYIQVKEIKNNIYKIKEDILNDEKIYIRESKMISVIDNKIREYLEVNDINYIINSEKITIYDLDNKLIENLENIECKYKDLEKKKELIEKSKDIRERFIIDLENYENEFEDMYIGISNVICGTCSGIAGSNNNYFMEKEFEYVIIDEAAKCYSLDLLIPIIRGKKIILVGDHKQLSPAIEKEFLPMIEEDEYVNKDANNVNSLFGLIFDKADKNIKSILKKQYRMNSDISGFISKEFYNNELMDGENIININHGIKNLQGGLYWVNSGKKGEGLETYSETSFYNELETQIIIETLKWIDEESIKKEVGIISPYRAQKEYLLKQLSGLMFKNLQLEINTIDAFQGREKDIIIMNCVRNNDKGEFGHISGDARVNVAVSRARELLIVIGNEEFIKNNKSRAKSLYKLLQYTENNRCKISKDFFVKDKSGGIV